ncbi:GIY-YIG nuclease family protein [Nocardia sp. NPDC056100]|uniref:GIY-YIG nuclease family protein n=1 Tax=Nocardia sp. NPDC056100 TaxID=3345712 RepID=UPI0035D75CF5
MPEALDAVSIAELQPRPGVYQLYEDDVLVYVGKADNSLPQRLGKHRAKLQGRLMVGSMAFTCLYVDEDLHAVAPERLLIDRYKGNGLARWNYNGFGSNDPGKNRDETVFEEDHFDSMHPANLGIEVNGIEVGEYALAELLKRLKSLLPYVFRYQSADFHNEIRITISDRRWTADGIFETIGEALGRANPEWRITALPGYVIMYPKPGPYPSAQKQYSSVARQS